MLAGTCGLRGVTGSVPDLVGVARTRSACAGVVAVGGPRVVSDRSSVSGWSG